MSPHYELHYATGEIKHLLHIDKQMYLIYILLIVIGFISMFSLRDNRDVNVYFIAFLSRGVCTSNNLYIIICIFIDANL